MNEIIINKGILLSDDFSQNFEDILCAYLNSLIDAELEKGDETDFDLIDEYASAINYIRENGVSEFFPVISKNDFMAKALSQKTSAFQKALVACAAAAVIIATGIAVTNSTDNQVIKATADRFRKLFNMNSITYTQPEPTTNEKEKTTAPEVVTGLELEFSDDFRTDYYVGESFSPEGLTVYALTNLGRKAVKDYTINVPDNFSQKAGKQNISVSALGFTQSFTVRILNSESTPVLNSIYATFPEGYDFTYQGEPDLSDMQVYAVFSTGEERELAPSEYTVTIEKNKGLFRETAQVTIEYEGCNCAFILEEVLR